jgi:hypothetical protein
MKTNWINPSNLWLLVLVAIPIVLHFLLRERVKKVAFSAVRFLRGHSRESLSRRKWLEWLLTLLRVVCVAVLVIAFARPFLQTKMPEQPASGQRLTVVMLDVSRSMSYADRLAKAKKIADSVIDASDAAGGFRIVTFADGGPIHASEAGDKAAAKDAIERAVLTSAATDVPNVLERIFSDLRRRSAGGEVHLISDLQLTALPPNRAAPALPPGSAFHVHAVASGPHSPAGVAIAGAAPYVEVLPGERNVEISARVMNRGPARDAVAQLLVEGKVVGSRIVQLPQNGEAVTTVSATVKEPGEHRAQIVIKNPAGGGAASAEPKDAPTILHDDNRFNVVLHVVDKIRVAIVNGHPSPEPAQDAAFFFAKALTAGEESPFDVAIAPTLPKSENVDVVVLAGVGALPAEDASRLGEFVRKGGGLLIGVGPGTGIDAFDNSLAAVLPARLRATKDDAAGRFFIPADLKHPLVQRMVAEGSGDLTTAHFRSTYELKDTQDARVILRFDDNRPALVEKTLGHASISPPTAATMMSASVPPLPAASRWMPTPPLPSPISPAR